AAFMAARPAGLSAAGHRILLPASGRIERRGPPHSWLRASGRVACSGSCLIARVASVVYTAPPIAGVRQGLIVSKQDTHFFNVFSVVIGLLVAIAICLFVLA